MIVEFQLEYLQKVGIFNGNPDSGESNISAIYRVQMHRELCAEFLGVGCIRPFFEKSAFTIGIAI